MKNHTILKSTICGLIIGIAVMISIITGFGGQVMYFLSLGFILNFFKLSDENQLVAMIPFFIIVWTTYGAITGIILHKLKKI